MEKISRILPPSARTQSYDVSRAQPVRPGAPSMGRPADVIQDRMTISDQMLGPIMNGDTLPTSSATTKVETYKPKDTVKAQMVKEMTDKFFVEKNNPKNLARETDESHSEEMATRAQSSANSL